MPNKVKFITEEKPRLGDRVLIEVGGRVIGAVLVKYLGPDDYFFMVDNGKMLAIEQVETWMDMPPWI